MHASVPLRSGTLRAARRLGSARVTFRYVEMRHCMMHNTLHVTESLPHLPRGNCVLRWLSQLRHVRKRYLLASKSRPRLPVSRGWQWRFDIDATFSDGNSFARKHLRFRWRLYIRGFYYDIRARRLCRPIEKELPQCNCLKITVNREWFATRLFFFFVIGYPIVTVNFVRITWYFKNNIRKNIATFC